MKTTYFLMLLLCLGFAKFIQFTDNHYITSTPSAIELQQCIDSVYEGREKEDMTDGDYLFCETLVTDCPRNICDTFQAEEGISVKFDEMDTDGIVTNYGLDYLSDYEYRTLLLHSKPF